MLSLRTSLERSMRKIIVNIGGYLPDYSEYNGLISDDNIKRDLEEIHLNKVYSNTYLEAYSKCPYYFYVEY